MKTLVILICMVVVAVLVAVAIHYLVMPTSKLANDIKPADPYPYTSQAIWEGRVTELGNQATERMYQCISEMYAIGHGRGPVCQEACVEYAALIAAEQEHPDWMVQLGVGKMNTMPSKKVCMLKSSKEEKP